MPWSHTCILALEVSLPFHAAIVLSPRLVVPLEAYPLAALTADLANVAHGGALTANLQPLVDVESMLLHCSHQRDEASAVVYGISVAGRHKQLGLHCLTIQCRSKSASATQALRRRKPGASDIHSGSEGTCECASNNESAARGRVAAVPLRDCEDARWRVEHRHVAATLSHFRRRCMLKHRQLSQASFCT